jgi:hypothetical protein
MFFGAFHESSSSIVIVFSLLKIQRSLPGCMGRFIAFLRLPPLLFTLAYWLSAYIKVEQDCKTGHDAAS